MPKILFEAGVDSYRITLNDPPLNILDLEMLDELREALGRVKNDKHVLLITGNGTRAFSAGASVSDHLGDRVKTMLSSFHGCFRLLDKLELVTVALVNGVALGGGCELALACDFVIASDKASFGQPEIKLGVFPPVAAIQLSSQLPPRRGLEMLLTGEPIDASAAAELGIVNKVIAADDFEAGSNEWLNRLTSKSAAALRFAKIAFRKGQSSEFDGKLARIEELYLDELMKSEDATEGLNAFLEKRKPAWSHR